MKCKDCKAVCALRDKSSTGERECAYQAQIISLPDPIDWFNFRCIAAKDFLVAMITHSGTCANPKDDNCIRKAIDYADELVKQLKEQK